MRSTGVVHLCKPQRSDNAPFVSRGASTSLLCDKLAHPAAVGRIYYVRVDLADNFDSRASEDGVDRSVVKDWLR